MTIPAAHAKANHGYDDFDHATFKKLASSGGVLPVSGAVFSDQSETYDSSAYTFQSDGPTNERDLTRCGDETTTYWGAKTGWLRLTPAVKGTLFISATTNYDLFLQIVQMPDARPAGGYRLDEVSSVLADCDNTRKGMPDEGVQVIAEANRTVFIQTAGVCGSGASSLSACPTPGTAPGGATTVAIAFTPNDADGDAVPDSVDQCPNEAAVTPTGCPDRDLDGVRDAVDLCPDVKGDPPRGCPADDADHDGATVPRDCDDANPAIHPGAPELVNNLVDENCDGVLEFDRDGDGSRSPGADCNDANRAVHPGAPGIAGNGLDDDCDGKPESFTALNVEPSLFVTATRSGVVVHSLRLRNVTRGARVEVSCGQTRKRLCQRQVRRARLIRLSRSLSFPDMGGKRMRSGARIEIRVTAKGMIGRYVRYQVRRGGFKRIDRCLDADSKKPRARCQTRAF